MSEFVSALKVASEAIQKKDYSAVIQHAEQSLALSAKEALSGKKLEVRNKELCNVYLMLGVAYFNLDQLTKAEDSYRKAQELDPQNKDPWQGLIQIYKKNNDKPKLVHAITSLIALIPKGVKRWVSLTTELAMEIEPTEAKPLWQSVVDALVSEHKSIEPEFKQFNQALARAHILEMETDAERKEQLEVRTTRQLEKIRKEKLDKAADEKRRGISKDLTSTEASRKKEDAASLDEEVDIRRRVANKYEQTLLARTELDDLYKSLVKHPLVSSAERFYQPLISRMVTRIRLANNQEEADKFETEAIAECKEMMLKCTDSVFAAEIFLALTLNFVITEEQQSVIDRFPSNWVACVGKSISLAKSSKTDAILPLASLPAEPPSPASVLFLSYYLGLCIKAKLEVGLGTFAAARTSVQKANNLLSPLRIWHPFSSGRIDRFERDTQLSLARAEAGDGKEQRTVELAIERFRSLSTKAVDADELEQAFRGIAECALMKLVPDYVEADSACQELLTRQPKNAWALSLRGWLCYRKDPNNHEGLLQAVDFVKQALELEPTEPQHSLRLGKLYWQLGGDYKTNPQYALQMFQTASANAPQLSEPLACLGDYYAFVSDEKQAREQYEKALALDKSCKAAGVAMFDIYAASNQLLRARAMCERAIKRDSRAHWAWVRLGRVRRADKFFADASIAFQNALRLDSEDGSSWEELGECYLKLERFAPALACFTRACEISVTNSRLYLKADAYHRLNQHAEAAEILQCMVEESDEKVFVPALKLLAEVSLRNAQTLLLQGAFNSCSSQLHLCKSLLLRCSGLLSQKPGQIQVPSQLLCLHKLLGDALALFAQLPEAEKIKYMLEADAAYAKLIELSPSSAAAFYDRGVNYFQISLVDEEEKKREEWLLKSNECFQNALKLEPNSSLLWTALGVTCTRPQVRQHCFIRALQINSRYAEAWCSLAFLYMQYGNWLHARRAFEKAQSCDPANPGLWLGQGLFNQQIGTAQAQEQAGAAYRRSVELRPSLQARLGLGYAAYLGGNIEEAAFSLRKCVEQSLTHATAYNLLGLALEQRGQHKQAIEAFESSIKLISKEKGSLLSQLNSVKTNLARVLALNGDHKEACEMYKQIETSNYNTYAAAAFSQTVLGNKEQSIENYTLALKILQEDKTVDNDNSKVIENRRSVICDLARAHWAFKDKTAAQKCLRQDPALIDSTILAMDCAMALRSGDLESASRILTEMKSLPSYEASEWHNLKALEARTNVERARAQQGDENKVKAEEERLRVHLASRVFLDPTNSGYWDDLGEASLHSRSAASVICGTHNPPPAPASTSHSSLQLLSAAYRAKGALQGSVPVSEVEEVEEEKDTDIVVQDEDKEEDDDSGAAPESEAGEKKIRFARSARLDAPVEHVHKTPNSFALRLLRADPFSVEGWVEVGLNTHAKAIETRTNESLDGCLRTLAIAIKCVRDKLASTSSSSSSSSVISVLSSQLLVLLMCVAECQFLRFGSFDMNSDLLREINDKASKFPSLQSALAMLHARLSTSQKKVSLLRDSLRLAPGNTLAWEEMAAYYFDNESTLAGELCLKSALQVLALPTYQLGVEPRSAWRVQLRLARLYYFSKRYVPGLEAVGRALVLLEQLGLESPSALCLQGLFYRKSRKWKEAEACFLSTLKCHDQSMLRMSRPLLSSDDGARTIALLNLAAIQAKDGFAAEMETSILKAKSLSSWQHLSVTCQTYWTNLTSTPSLAPS